MNAPIKLRTWWNEAGSSGKQKFGTVENLAAMMGLTVPQLETILDQEVSTLTEWWDKIGMRIYKAKGKQGMAQELTLLLPEALKPFPRQTLSDYINARKSPKYREYRAALFAMTALPCFRPTGEGEAGLTHPPLEVGVGGSATRLFRISAESFTQQLLELSNLHLDRAEKVRLKKILTRVQAVLNAVLEQDEDNALAANLGQILGTQGGKNDDHVS